METGLAIRCRRGVAALVGLLVLTGGWGRAGAEVIHQVKRGETLSGIARRYGVSAARLAELNGIGRSGHVYAGQRLVIPDRETFKPRLTASVQRAIESANVRPGRWRYIVLHHSGVNVGSVQSMDRYHREERHMEHGLAYHFVIGNGNGMADGEVVPTRRWHGQLDGGHLASEAQNKVALGICLVGNFDQRKPTERQMESLQALVEALLKRCRLSPSAVKTHQQINVVKTRCPGRLFPFQRLMREINANTATAAR
ncbi:MAG: N-acetylmuramoyl-L-alanine amidase [Verrucomicrobiales bacterium]|nr:N-acetylmuramoyl-L-alanine amidase [Verrucomicrobiales bacterium]